MTLLPTRNLPRHEARIEGGKTGILLPILFQDAKKLTN